MPNDEGAYQIAVHPHGPTIASANGARLKIWRGSSAEATSHGGDQHRVAPQLVEKSATTAGNLFAKTLDVHHWELIRQFQLDKLHYPMCWSPDRRFLVVGQVNLATLHDAETFREVARFTSPNEAGNIESFRFSTDGGQLAIAYRSAIEVWDLRLVRQGLQELGADWESPPLAPATTATLPRRIEFDLGSLAPRPRQENAMENARLFALQNDWPAAAREYEKALETGTTYAEYLFEIAGGLLIGGQPEKYQQAYRLLFQEHGRTDDDRTAYLLARTAALRPDSYGNPDVRRLARLAVESGGENAWYLHTLGLVCYREGKYDEAVEYLEKSARQPWDAQIVNWIALAMAYHQLGDQEKSRQRWRQAVQWLDEPQPLHPHDRVAVKILADEARQIPQLGMPPDRDPL